MRTSGYEPTYSPTKSVLFTNLYRPKHNTVYYTVYYTVYTCCVLYIPLMAARKYKSFLLLLSELEFKQFQCVLSEITSEQKLALREVIVNFLQNNLTVESSVVEKLRRYKKFLIELASCKVDRKLSRKKARLVWTLLRHLKKQLENRL